VLGRELEDLFPVAFLPRDHALAVAIMSYNGGIDFGLLGDFDAMPDLEEFGRMLGESRDELVAAARSSGSNGRRGGRAKAPAATQ
jgi:diacylglycerol O-acyltransferase / wax synthase